MGPSRQSAKSTRYITAATYDSHHGPTQSSLPPSPFPKCSRSAHRRSRGAVDPPNPCSGRPPLRYGRPCPLPSPTLTVPPFRIARQLPPHIQSTSPIRAATKIRPNSARRQPQPQPQPGGSARGSWRVRVWAAGGWSGMVGEGAVLGFGFGEAA